MTDVSSDALSLSIQWRYKSNPKPAFTALRTIMPVLAPPTWSLIGISCTRQKQQQHLQRIWLLSSLVEWRYHPFKHQCPGNAWQQSQIISRKTAGKKDCHGEPWDPVWTHVFGTASTRGTLEDPQEDPMFSQRNHARHILWDSSFILLRWAIRATYC